MSVAQRDADHHTSPFLPVAAVASRDFAAMHGYKRTTEIQSDARAHDMGSVGVAP